MLTRWSMVLQSISLTAMLRGMPGAATSCTLPVWPSASFLMKRRFGGCLAAMRCTWEAAFSVVKKLESVLMRFVRSLDWCTTSCSLLVNITAPAASPGTQRRDISIYTTVTQRPGTTGVDVSMRRSSRAVYVSNNVCNVARGHLPMHHMISIASIRLSTACDAPMHYLEAAVEACDLGLHSRLDCIVYRALPSTCIVK
jgi:hypothetical protein